MAFEIKNNSGSVFKNQKKESDKHPDLSGQALIDDKAYWVSAWRKTDKNGNAWFSFSFKEKDSGADKPKAVSQNDFGDDIPFSYIHDAAIY